MQDKEDHKRTEGARTKASTAGTVKKEGKIGGDWKFSKNPTFLAERTAVWDELFAKQTDVYAGKSYFIIIISCYLTRQNKMMSYFLFV